ncbi:porin [Leeia oryzae]|uniref:porin n=1 Tax=Leeia oryzae TaxID=356662 RepID=UPI000370BB6D|nr:porin [Leeia oryzae]
MKQKMIYALVVAACSHAAMADSGNVTISGMVRSSFQHVGHGNSTFYLGQDSSASQNQLDGRVDLTFAGTEDLGNGLATVWSVATRSSLDGTGSDEFGKFGAINNGGKLGSLESFIGLKGNFGQIRFGHGMDNYGDGKHNWFMVNGGEYFGSVTNPIYKDNNNVVRYDMPTIGNLDASIRLNLGENKTSSTAAKNGVSIRADYNTDSWDVGAAYAVQDGYASPMGAFESTTGKLHQYNLTGAYRFINGLELALEYEHTKSDAGPAKKETTMYVNYPMGKWTIGGEVGRATNVGFTDGLKNKLYGVYGRYELSKRTLAYAEYISSKENSVGATRSNLLTIGLAHFF